MAEYSPTQSLTGLRKLMQERIAGAGELVIPGTQVAPTIAVIPKAETVCVLLACLASSGPVPDDITGLTTGQHLKDHVRADGGIYRGAYEMQGQPDSVVLVYADPRASDHHCEAAATMERPVLTRRFQAWQLGPFGIGR